MSFYISSLGEIVILAIIVGILFAVDVNASAANNNRGLSVLIAFGTGVWVLLAIPWFLKEKRRAGQQVKTLKISLLGQTLIKTGSHEHEHHHSRALATLQSTPTNLAAQTIPRLPHRLLPTWRLPQHHRNRHRSLAKLNRRLRHTHSDLSPNRRNRGPSSRNLQLLVDSATIPPLDENHVQCRRPLHHSSRCLG